MLPSGAACAILSLRRPSAELHSPREIDFPKEKFLFLFGFVPGSGNLSVGTVPMAGRRDAETLETRPESRRPLPSALRAAARLGAAIDERESGSGRRPGARRLRPIHLH